MLEYNKKEEIIYYGFLQGLNELNNMIGDPGHIGGALRNTIVFINKCTNNSSNLATKVRTPNIVVSCPKCSTLFSEEDTFCNNCGEKLIKVEITHKCSNCNAAYNEGDSFCNSCGSELIANSNIIEQE